MGKWKCSLAYFFLSVTREGREVSGFFEIGFDKFPTYHAFNINVDHNSGKVFQSQNFFAEIWGGGKGSMTNSLK